MQQYIAQNRTTLRSTKAVGKTAVLPVSHLKRAKLMIDQSLAIADYRII